MGLTAAESANSQWRKKIEKFWNNLIWSDWSKNIVLKTLLYKLYLLLESAPSNLLQKFDRFQEEELAAAARASMPNLSGVLGVPNGVLGQDDERLIWLAAVALRALDELLLEISENVFVAEAPSCWLTDDLKAYIVPVPRTVMAQGGPKTGQNFSRRGLLYHRIIPTKIEDVDILLAVHPDVTRGGSNENGRLFGAALFPDFHLNCEQFEGSRFLANSADCLGGIGFVAKQHCEAASAAGCDTLLWPELSMDPESVANVREYLGNCPLSADLPAIIVAGSWHAKRGEHFYNLAPVLDGRGELILTFGKNRLFSFNGLTENVEIFGKIHILVTDRELIAFAICKDFCDKARAVPIMSLDVDLVLVPSLGNDITITSHRDAADIMKVQYGTRVVVVQQAYPQNEEGPLGYILRGLKTPSLVELSNIAENLNFTSFHRE